MDPRLRVFVGVESRRFGFWLGRVRPSLGRAGREFETRPNSIRQSHGQRTKWIQCLSDCLSFRVRARADVFRFRWLFEEFHGAG